MYKFSFILLYILTVSRYAINYATLLFLSFQNATKIISKLFTKINKGQPEKNDINILIATQELESFAINYSKIHYETNEEKVISQESFGEFGVGLRRGRVIRVRKRNFTL